MSSPTFPQHLRTLHMHYQSYLTSGIKETRLPCRIGNWMALSWWSDSFATQENGQKIFCPSSQTPAPSQEQIPLSSSQHPNSLLSETMLEDTAGNQICQNAWRVSSALFRLLHLTDKLRIVGLNLVPCCQIQCSTLDLVKFYALLTGISITVQNISLWLACFAF